MRARPPKRRCLVCGGDYYGYPERDCCERCWKERAPDRAALVAGIKDQRGGQTRRPDVAPSAPVPYGEFPDGF